MATDRWPTTDSTRFGQGKCLVGVMTTNIHNQLGGRPYPALRCVDRVRICAVVRFWLTTRTARRVSDRSGAVSCEVHGEVVIRFRWYVWLLASLPAVVVVLAAVLGVLDSNFLSTRASIVLSGLTITFSAVALLAFASRPWRGGRGLRRIVAVAATGLAAAGAVLFGSMAIGTIQEEVFDSPLQGALAVVATDNGLIAVGNDASGNAVVWLSESGESWVRSEHSDALAGVDVADVAVFESRVLVVGQDSETGMGTTLSSTDGVDWRRDTTVAHNLNPPVGIEMTRLLEDLATTAAWKPQGVADVAGDLVIVGDTYGNATVFWYSPDAVAWSVAEPLPVFDTGNEAVDVVAWSSGFLALGVDSDGEAEVWTSETGETWTLHGTEIDGHPTLAAATSDTVMLVESTNAATRLWISLDAETWTRHDAEALSSSRVEAISSTTAGFAAVGIDSAGNRIMWFSPNGSTWATIASHPKTSDTFIYDIVPVGASLVAVGYDQESNTAAFWTVSDELGWVRISVDQATASLH